ncbi:MAG: hydroxymethylglutaryl-CoA lyase [Bacteroidetes bacterium]|nr:hydroxymethylglutaryl-CoA lyase [Bacteroidota bacterium]
MSILKKIRLTDCPRDAMQGIREFIPTGKKVQYLNSLLKVGFDILDFGSFVSPKAIPQLSDTADVLRQLDLSNTDSKLLAVIGNMKGAEIACQFDEISYLGFPFSISDNFLRLNINSSIESAFDMCRQMLEKCDTCNKTLMIYISMGFGNPYNEPWSVQLLAEWVNKLKKAGAVEINLSDTIGLATKESITNVFNACNEFVQDMNLGLHLHSRSDDWFEKIDAAYDNACNCFDAVLTGQGGCPMTGYELVGNIQMSKLISHFEEKGLDLNINNDALRASIQIAEGIF